MVRFCGWVSRADDERMFVRKKANKSGSISVQVIDKAGGYRVVKSIGAARDPDEVQRFVAIGKAFIVQQRQQRMLFPESQHDNVVVQSFVKTLQNASIRTLGPELIFGRLFDEIGFNAIPEELFRAIVIARLVYPTSKLKTADYLYRYQGRTVLPDNIYRFLDRLNEHHVQQVRNIVSNHSRKILKSISVVFYDMTSLYFEASDEDDLRKIGYSKDGKFQNPQIMLGLLVGENGYPIGYDIFEGNTFEGKTLLPVLNRIQKEHEFGRPVVVTDAAMLSEDNLEELEKEQYPFIVAARMGNESQQVQQEILASCSGMTNGQTVEMNRGNGRRLIVSYSDKRAKKDAYNRQRGLQRLAKQIGSGHMTKKQINNRGYNKFLKLTGPASKVNIEIDQSKVERSARWDGLKGYLTNTNLSAATIIANYGQLWHIEKAFRISKTDLRIRPMFHRRRRRIEAHVLVAFVAYTIYKELERRLGKANIPISPSRAIELTQTMYEMTFALPSDPTPQRVLLQMDDQQRLLHKMLYE
jgi:hypothetical protein